MIVRLLITAALAFSIVSALRASSAGAQSYTAPAGISELAAPGGAPSSRTGILPSKHNVSSTGSVVRRIAPELGEVRR